MQNRNDLIHLVARIAMGLLFVMSGYTKITQMGAAGFGGIIESQLSGMGFLAWPVMFFELFAGIILIIGFQTRIIAIALAIFCVVTGLIFHGLGDLTGMLKNICLAGGFLLLYIYGAGTYALDNRKK